MCVRDAEIYICVIVCVRDAECVCVYVRDAGSEMEKFVGVCVS